MLEQPDARGLAGRNLGGFLLGGKIAEGGFGEVYRAEQTQLGREAVIKVLRTELRSNDAVVARFLREARLASHFDHPFAAHVYAFGAEADGVLWIAMELVRGTPLNHFLKQHGPMTLERFLPLFDRLCEVVQSAHEQGIIHRDIKPSNVIMLSRAGRLLPKLLDFGIAKLDENARGELAMEALSGDIPADAPPADDFARGIADLSKTAELGGAASAAIRTFNTVSDLAASQMLRATVNQITVVSGHSIGTPHYMAPEQWIDSSTVDGRTDVYALAVLAYECLTGVRPFEGKNIREIARAHASKRIPPLGPGFPAALDEVLARGMARDPRNRYPTVLAFANEFRETAREDRESAALPNLDEALRDALVATAPQPIAEAAAELETARSAQKLRRAARELWRQTAHYLGLLALSSRSRVGAGAPQDSGAAIELCGRLRRRSLKDSGWIELGRELTRPFAARPQAHPIPELVSFFFPADGTSPDEAIDVLVADQPEERSDDQNLAEYLKALGRVLRGCAFVCEYGLVVWRRGQFEKWMGIRRPQRLATNVADARDPVEDRPMLVHADGRCVLSLWPLMQVAEPAPGTPRELFFLSGKGSYGARLTAHPLGFERDDEAVWEWFAETITDVGEEASLVAREERSPYRGLASFTGEDAANFFGREVESQAFVNRLRLQGLIAVVGPSGAGKSSFLQAGVFPLLPPGWRTIVVRPGPSPIEALEARLRAADLELPNLRRELERDVTALGRHLRSAAVASGTTLLLLIDQFEELLTLCLDPNERQLYAEALVLASGSPDDPVRILLAMRDDFLARAGQLSALRSRLTQGIQLLTTPAADDLLRILTEPARRSGYEFENPELPREMVRSVAEQPGALALLSFTASKLWELRDRHFKQLRTKAYETLGGVGGALARHAEETLAGLGEEKQKLVREAFRHLVTADGTRAILNRPELLQVLGGGSAAEIVIDHLLAARLLVSSEEEAGGDRIEVIHEALIGAWPRLVKWRNEDAEGARLRDQLRAAARQWHERGRARGLLWRAEALTEYQLWRVRYPGRLTETEEAFAAASVAEAVRGRRIRRGLLVSAFAILTAGMIVLLQLNQRALAERARAQQSAEETRQQLATNYFDQARQLSLQGNPASSAIYLSQALDLDVDTSSLRLLLKQTLGTMESRLLELGHPDKVIDAVFSPDGTRIVTGCEDGAARIWDARDGALLATTEPHQRSIWAVTFAPGSDRFLTASTDGVAGLWSTADGKSLARLQHKAFVTSAEFNQTGDRIVTASEDGTARVWDRNGKPLLELLGHDGPLWYAIYSHDGQFIATAGHDQTARIWDSRTGAMLHKLEGNGDLVYRVAFSPDDQMLALASGSTASVFSMRDGHLVARLQGHTAPVTSVVFSPAGDRLATGSFDSSARTWDLQGRLLTVMAGHKSFVNNVVWSRDIILTSSSDGSARAWDASSGIHLTTFAGHSSAVFRAYLNPTGDRVVTASWDGSARVWRLGSPVRILPDAVDHTLCGEQKQVLFAHHLDGKSRRWAVPSAEPISFIGGRTDVVKVACSTEQKLFALAAETGELLLGSASAPPVTVSGKLTGKVTSLAWEPSLSEFVVGDDSGQVATIGAGGNFTTRVARDGNAIRKIVFHPQRTSVALLGAESMRLFELPSWAPIRTLAVKGPPSELSYGVFVPPFAFTTQDQFVTCDFKGVCQLWGMRQPDPIATLRNSTTVADIAVNAAGTQLGVALGDGTSALWQLPDTFIGLLMRHNGSTTRIVYSADDKFLATGGDDGTVRVWDSHSLQEIAALTSHPGAEVVDVQFASNGKALVARGGRGSIIVWSLDLDPRNKQGVKHAVDCLTPLSLGKRGLQPRTEKATDCSR